MQLKFVRDLVECVKCSTRPLPEIKKLIFTIETKVMFSGFF